MAQFSKINMLFALKLSFNGGQFCRKIIIQLEKSSLTISLNICNQKFITQLKKVVSMDGLVLGVKAILRIAQSNKNVMVGNIQKGEE